MEFNEKMSLSEKLSYYIIHTKMKNYNIKFNEQQSHGETDFELTLNPDSHIVPVEVTSSVDKNFIEIYKNLIKKEIIPIYRKQGRRYKYRVDLTKHANINLIKNEIDDFLYSLEQEITEFNYPLNITDKIKHTKMEKYIDSVEIIDDSKKGVIHINLPFCGNWVNENTINEIVNNEINKSDNRRKLNTGIKEKYFFIYIDNSNSMAWSAITRISQPQTLFKTDIKNLNVWIFAIRVPNLENAKCIIWKAHNNSKWVRDEISIPKDILTQILDI